MVRRNGGFIGTDGLDAPDPPTGVAGTAGNASVSVAFTAPTDTGTSAITSFIAQVGGIGALPNIGALTNTASATFDISAKETIVSGLAFSTSGDKMYIVGFSSDSTHEFTLSKPFDITTASFTDTFDSSSQEDGPRCIIFNPEGTKMYIAGNGEVVYQYTLSTGFDLTTVSYASLSLNVSGQVANPGGIRFNNDGTNLYVLGADDIIYQYALSTAYKIDTGSYSSKTLSGAGLDNGINDFIFNANGTRLYMCASQTDKVHQFSLSTAFDISTGSFDVSSAQLKSSDQTATGIAFNTDFTKMFLTDSDTETIKEYACNITSSPVSIFSLTNNTAVTAVVRAINAYGTSAPSDASASFTPFAPTGLVAGGAGLGDTIEFFTIPSTGNATDFGNLIASGEGFTGGGNSIRALFIGNSSKVINFVVYASAGNATDFGDMITSSGYAGGTSSMSSTTRTVFCAGIQGNPMEYVTIASEGNATDFGNMHSSKIQLCAMSSSSGRGVMAGGRDGSTVFNNIEYIAIATLGNGTDFGDLSATRCRLAACSSATRGVVGGGHQNNATMLNVMEYITMANTGNTTDFGDLTVARKDLTAFSSSVRGVFAGGHNGSNTLNTVDYITIASTGNASDFGDLSTNADQSAGASNDHGGLQ